MAVTADVSAHLLQSNFRVVARRQWLDDLGLSFSVQARQQDCGLHLGARNGQLVPHRPEFATLDFERRQPAFSRPDARPHPRQRLHHALHRATGQRRVALDDGPKGLARENAA